MNPVSALAAATARLGLALAGAWRDVRGAWSRRATAWVLGYAALAVAAPLLIPAGRMGTAAAGLYVALAAVGLNFAVGLAGLPSLGQGAFVGIGAFAVALLTSRAGWSPGAATLAGAGAATVAGLLAGWGAVRLATTSAAVSTWALAWLVSLGLAAFPGLFGGARGVPVGPLPGPDGALPGGQLTALGHLEVALALLALCLVVTTAVRRGPAGRSLATAEQAPGTARALGIEPGGRRLGAFVASALVGGLAGGLAVQVAGVADASEYGPLLSVELFVAVLIGGRGTVLGPVAGAAVLGLVGPASRALADLTGTEAGRVEGVIAAALLAVALVAGGTGAGGLPGRLRLAGRGRAEAEASELGDPAPLPATRGRQRRPRGVPLLEAQDLEVRFGGVVALNRVSLAVRGGEIHAVIGPNGSGKTTLLRALGGTVDASGTIRLGRADLSRAPVRTRVRAGLVRTLQRTAVAPGLSVLDHALTGADARRRTGPIRTLVATPAARAETRALEREVRALLRLAGLDAGRSLPVATLNGEQQRLMAIVTALAARPRVVLLDEPAAGMSARGRERLAGVLLRLRQAGLAIVVVEHDVRLVRTVADTATVLDAGVVIARGTPAAVARNPKVIRAYLGPQGLGRSRDL